MTDIFLSYASADRDRAQTLAQALQRHGYKVWWDRTIPPGRVFDEVIQEALQGARCVVVLWSEQSVRSNWVKTEAAEGVAQNKLVPALLDPVPPPIEFKRIQAADLSGWNGDDDHSEYGKLIAAIDERLSAPEASAAVAMGSVSGAGRAGSDGAAVDRAARGRGEPDRTGSDRVPSADLPASKPTGTPILAIMSVLGVLGIVGAFGVHWLQSRSASQTAPATDVSSAGNAAGRPGAGSTQPVDRAPSAAPAASTPAAAPATAAPNATTSAPADARINLLSAENGGELVTASNERWTNTIDGKEDTYAWTDDGQAVFSFRGGQAATFDTFAVLIPNTADTNLKDFELLWSNDPNGGFKSIGKFSTQNLRIMKNPYQEFSFEPVRAKYLKVRSLKNHTGSVSSVAYEFRLYGRLDQ